MASKINEYFNYFCGLSDKIFKAYDPMKIYYVNYWIFVFSGFWNYASPKKWKTSLYKFYQNSVILVYGVSLLFFITDAIIVSNDFNKLAFNMSSSVLVMMKVFELYLLWRFRDMIEEMYDRLDNHLFVNSIGNSEEDKRILKQKAESVVNITLMFYSLLLIGLPLRVLADTALETRNYLIPVPFKEKLDDYYEYVYAQQVIVSFHFMMTTLAYDLLGFTFTIRFFGHFEILEKNILKIKKLYPRRNFEKYVRGYAEGDKQAGALKYVLIKKTNYSQQMENFFGNYQLHQLNSNKGKEGEKRREEKTFQLLKENINHHQKLLTEIKNFSTVYSRPLLIQACGMAIIIGIAVLQILFISTDVNPMFLQQLIYAFTTIMNIIYLCSFGSELTSKSLSAANALYDTPWYEMNISNRNVVFLILKRLMEAPTLKGGDIITIDRVMCVKFAQFSYNIVALLRNKL